MLTVKLFLNIIVLTPNEKFISIKVKDSYLNMPMPRYEYMRLKLNDLPENIIQQYNLRGKVSMYDYIYTEIHRGMYRLPAAGILS